MPWTQHLTVFWPTLSHGVRDPVSLGKTVPSGNHCSACSAHKLQGPIYLVGLRASCGILAAPAPFRCSSALHPMHSVEGYPSKTLRSFASITGPAETPGPWGSPTTWPLTFPQNGPLEALEEREPPEQIRGHTTLGDPEHGLVSEPSFFPPLQHGRTIFLVTTECYA